MAKLKMMVWVAISKSHGVAILETTEATRTLCEAAIVNTGRNMDDYQIAGGTMTLSLPKPKPKRKGK